MIIFFASPEYEPQKLNDAMNNAFPKTELFGCTRAGEIVSGKMLKKQHFGNVSGC